MCVDFKYMNRVSPNDDFLLPHYDILMDKTAKNSI